jgi:hypothetical protein
MLIKFFLLFLWGRVCLIPGQEMAMGKRIRQMKPIPGDNADTGRATKYHEAERRYGFHPLENERHSK